MRSWLAACLLALTAVAAPVRADESPDVDRLPAPAPAPTPAPRAEPGATAAPEAPPDEASTPPPSAPPPSAAPPVGPEDAVIHVRATPVRASEAARAPGAAATTIDAARYAGEAKTTAALLATSPGVAVTEHGADGQRSQVSIRGSSAEQVKILVDGLQLNGAAGGGVDLSTIPAAWISRIEVVRGTEGVHHGSGALGGVVNVVTLPASPGAWGASATAGSFGSWAGDLHLGTGGEGWGLLGAGHVATTRGDFPYQNVWFGNRREVRDHDASTQGGGLLKGFWRMGGGRLDAAAQLSAGRRDLPGSIQDPTPRDWQRDGRGLVTARWRRPLGQGPVLSAGAWLRADRLDVSLAEVNGGEPSLQRGLAGGGSLGFWWQGRFAALSGSAEVGGERLSADGVGVRSRATLAGVLAAELSALGGRLRIAPSARAERIGAFQGISARLGAAADLAGPFSLRAGAGRTYRVPSFAELHLQQGVVAPNPDLRPEVGVSGDAALVASGWAGTLSLGGFYVLYDDLVVYEAASFRRFTPRNDARSSARGLEAEGATAPLRRVADLSLAAAYTLLDTETLRGGPTVIGKELPQKPRHRLHARVSAGGGPLEVHADAQWASRRFVDLANTRALPGVFLLDAGGGVRLWREADVHLNLEVRNLLDDRTAEDGFMNPLPGRAVFVTVRAGATP